MYQSCRVSLTDLYGWNTFDEEAVAQAWASPRPGTNLEQQCRRRLSSLSSAMTSLRLK